jgi:Fic family protein
MAWNWELEDWPHFTWDAARLTRAETLYAEQAGILVGASQHLGDQDREAFVIQSATDEAYDTSAIEGEILDRASVQSSIARQFGLKADRRSDPKSDGMAELMVDLCRNLTEPISERRLFTWHGMVMRGRDDIEVVGGYRRDPEPMQIVSGPLTRQRVHFEAPPFERVGEEMKRLLRWVEATAPDGATPLPPLTRAGIGHIWFESIHPFEDGNGRIGRAIVEVMLAEGLSKPIFTGVAGTFLRRQKEYYQALEDASITLDINRWLRWFAAAVIESQRRAEAQIAFTLDKARLLARLDGDLNRRQEAALLRMFEAGPEGFKGGLSAKNYMTITGAPTATTTRDLADLVEKGALIRTGELKGTRYQLAVDLRPVETVLRDDA